MDPATQICGSPREREFVVPVQVSFWAGEPAAHASHEMLDVCGHLVLSRDFRPFWFPSGARRSGYSAETLQGAKCMQNSNNHEARMT